MSTMILYILLVCTILPTINGTSSTYTIPSSLSKTIYSTSSTFTVVTNITISIITRDNISLHTQIFFPTGYSPNGGPKPLGCVFHRTPYGIAGLTSYGVDIASAGFIAVNQDERGRYGSTGNYSFWRYSANDAADTLLWIRKQPWSNGKCVGTGVSADAIQQYVMPLADGGIGDMMKAQFNTVGMPTVHQLSYQDGAYRTGLINGWLTEIGEADSIQVIQNHEGYSEFWNPIEINQRWNLITYPIIHACGWYDIFSTLQVRAYLATQIYSNATQYLIMEAGGHCSQGAINWPNASWGFTVAEAFSNQLFSQVLSTSLNQEYIQQQYKPYNTIVQSLLQQDLTMLWYVLGPGDMLSTGNFWVGGTAFPAPVISKYSFGKDGNLISPSTPIQNENISFISDPANPVPTYGGNNLILKPCGPQDQRTVENDYAQYMTSFTSDYLVDPVAINGEILVNIFLSSTAIDTDIAVKLVDIFPTGESMLVQDGVLRMRWRDGPFATEPTFMTPNTIYNVTVSVGWMSYIFNPLHKIKVTIAGSNFPRFSSNPQDGSLMNTTVLTNITSVNTVYMDLELYPSALLLPTVPLQTLLDMRI